MILWVDGAHDPAENMRRDARLLDAAERGAESVLRLFRFEPHGITLGRSQRPEETLDLTRCRSDGIRWAIRPTGGGGIFHAEEWTFSLAASLEDPEWGGPARAAYARLGTWIAASLRRLGAPATMGPGGNGAPDRGAAPRPSGACFAEAARHEVLLEGRKLAGIAQRRTRRGVLQQGSILLGEGHLRWADYAACVEPNRASVRRTLALVTATAGAWISPDTTLERWADALAAERGTAPRRLGGEEGRSLLTLGETGSILPLRFAS
jgi:lipoate-protein ligase A